MDSLIENLLKVRATEHRKIQEEIRRNLRELGYYVKLEKKIWFGREGKIDVFAKKGTKNLLPVPSQKVLESQRNKEKEYISKIPWLKRDFVFTIAFLKID